MAPKSKSHRPTLYQPGTALWVIGMAIVITLVLIGSRGQLNQFFKGASLPSTNTSSQPVTLTAACTPISGSYQSHFGLNGSAKISEVQANIFTIVAGYNNIPPESIVVKGAGLCTVQCDCDAKLIPGPLKCPDNTVMATYQNCTPPSVPYKDSKTQLLFATAPLPPNKDSTSITNAATKALQAQCSAATTSLCSSACSTLPKLTTWPQSAASSSLENALDSSKPTASLTCKPNPAPIKPPSVYTRPGF